MISRVVISFLSRLLPLNRNNILNSKKLISSILKYFFWLVLKSKKCEFNLNRSKKERNESPMPADVIGLLF